MAAEEDIPDVRNENVQNFATDREAREWLYRARKNEFMLFYDFDRFEDFEILDNSADIIVKKAFLKPLTRNVTLMTHKISPFFTLKDSVTELQKYRKVAAHNNILTYAGLTQDPNLENFSIILDYAQGNLKEHLTTKKFTWPEKLKLATELVKGLYCIHSYEMFHGSLRSDNIGIINGSIKLHNFGRYRRVEENKKTLAQYFESIPYLDPQHLKNPKKFFRDQIISDIYSLGVLFWEISSQKPPFENFDEEPCKLGYLIVYEDLREEPVPDTPEFYKDLYQQCWNGRREKRPTTEYVLKRMITDEPSNSQ